MDTTIIYEQNPDWGKIHRLASENITYLIFEAGGSGKVREADINHHLDWITASLSSIGTIKVKSIKTNITGKNVWRNVTYFRAPYDCNWQPKKQPGETVGKNELLGYISSTRNVTRQILSSEDGIILWQKHDCTVPKSDTLIAIATN